MRLTRAQLAALEVLVLAGDRVRGSNRSSSMEPLPRVNSLAADTLCRLKLARFELASWTGAGDFRVTQAGREEWLRRG